MDVEVSGSKPSALVQIKRENSEKDRLCVKRTTLHAVLQQCQRALEMLDTTGQVEEEDEDENHDDENPGGAAVSEERRGGEADEV